MKEKIPSALVFLVMKIRKNIPSKYQKKCCKDKHVDLLLIGEEDKKHYVIITNCNTLINDY